MLAVNSLFAHAEDDDDNREYKKRYIKLYYTPVAAGSGFFLDGEDYEDFEIDTTVPRGTDFAIKVGGDSMTPRFIDGQIVFFHQRAADD